MGDMAHKQIINNRNLIIGKSMWYKRNYYGMRHCMEIINFALIVTTLQHTSLSLSISL